jgi:hypothetical protein
MRSDSRSHSGWILSSGASVPRLAPLTRLGMFAAVAALVFLTQGCIAAIALPLLKGGSPDKLSVASGQKEVKAELGKPIASQSTPDGGRVDTYDYRLNRTGVQSDAKFDGQALQGLGYYLLFNIATYGVLDLAVSSYLVYHTLTTDPRNSVKIAFGPDDRVAWIGSPSPYGPPDAAVPLSIGAIRESCRSQGDGSPSDRPVSDGGEYLRPSGDEYVRCVARRFAIWGIE